MASTLLSFAILLLPTFFSFLSFLSFCSLFSTATSQTNNSDTTPLLLRRVCGQNQTQNPQTFDINFVDSMETISRNIAETGFAFATSGNQSNEQVYGIGQCFNYLSSIDCLLCYAESRVQLPVCLPANSARVFLDGCFLAYADFNFSGDAVDKSDVSVCGSSKNLSNSAMFGEVANRLVTNLTSEAYKERNYFKVGSIKVSSGEKVYGMAQCWGSLNMSGCKKCLENGRESAIGCLPSHDGRALNAGCYVRYSTENFFERSPQASSGRSSALRRRLGVALGCIFSSAVIIGAAVIWQRRRASSTSISDTDGSLEIIRTISESHLAFKYEDLRQATNDFDQANKLGQGGYGSVYKGVLPDGKDIAVKRLFFNTRQWLDQFFNEVNLISEVQHKNLVKLLGCSVEGPESLLVYEYHRNSSLDHFLFDSFKKRELDWTKRVEICVGTAEGLAYLHDASRVRIIHRDIKASNILLDDSFKPKIADFGLARYFAEDQSHLSTGVAGTLGYMAPEYVVHGQLTEKADVYSYGILVLEVVTGRKNSFVPTSGHSLMSQIWEHFTSSTLIELLDPYLKGECPEQNVLHVFHVGLLCTQASPHLRPPMWKIVEMLTGKARELPTPTKPPFINTKGADVRSDGSGSSYLFSSSSKSPVSVNQLSLSIVRGR